MRLFLIKSRYLLITKTTNMVNKIKITKEQYNRIFASKLLNENTEKPKAIDLKKEVLELIKYFYGKTREFSPTLEAQGISYDDICDLLLNKKIIVDKGGHYEISKKMGSPENAKDTIEALLKTLLERSNPKEIEEESNFPAGVEPHTPDAPWNQKETEPIKTPETRNVEINGPLTTMGSNEELSILTDGTNKYVFLYGDLSETPLSGEEVQKFISTHKEELGYGLKDWDSETKRLVQLDDALINDLIATHSFDKKFIQALDPQLDEVTACAGSSGQYSGLFSGGNIKEPKQGETGMGVPIVKETMTATPSTVGPYDANALPRINRDGSYKKTPKTKAEKNTQIAGGTFVTIDNCTKLNNNKTAQNGGCSTGAVDNVVKQQKTSGNVSAPSLKK